MVDLYESVGGETGDGFYIFCFFCMSYLLFSRVLRSFL